MGNRAERVMLSNRAHIIGALAMLVDILVRMQDHRHRKRSMSRALRLAQIDVSARDCAKRRTGSVEGGTA